MMTRKHHVDYWLYGAAESLKDMRSALKSKRRSNAMFCGHLAVEKILKALCAVRNVKIDRNHKLLMLAKDSGYINQLSAIEQQELLTITSFNIEARYDDYKRRFHSICTPQYADKWSKIISRWCRVVKKLVIHERAALPNNEPDTQGLVK
jgi:HEPN domain-containing protein